MFEDSRFDQELLSFLKYSFSEDFENLEELKNEMLNDVDGKVCKKLRLSPSVLSPAPHTYANQFALAVNSGEGEAMRALLTSICDPDRFILIKRILSKVPSSKPRSKPLVYSPGDTAESFTELSSYLRDGSYVEFRGIDSYVSFYSIVSSHCPDAIFNILSVRTVQSQDTDMIMVGYRYEATLIEPSKDQICPVPAGNVQTQRVQMRGSMAMYVHNISKKVYRCECFSHHL